MVWQYQYSSCSCVSTVIKLIDVPLNTDLTNHRSHDNREVLLLHEKNEDHKDCNSQSIECFVFIFDLPCNVFYMINKRKKVGKYNKCNVFIIQHLSFKLMYWWLVACPVKNWWHCFLFKSIPFDAKAYIVLFVKCLEQTTVDLPICKVWS